MSKAVQRAYNQIRDDILSGHLKPGERLREEELVAKVGVSRTPVREALRQLAADGYAIVQSTRGATVASFTRRDVDEIYGLRALLESHAARRAASRITPEQIQRMEELNAQMRALSKSWTKGLDHQLQRADLNQLFHEVILEASDNLRLAAMVRQLAQTAFSARTFASYDQAGEERALENHDEIIRALKSGHPDWAEAAMRGHIHNARQTMTAVAVNADS